VCDGAGWHQQGKRLCMPHNITLLRLPPYSPELNPMENIWGYLRGNKLSRLVWDSYEAIVAACKDAWDFLIGDPQRIDSIARRSWASVNH
jgi:transposase